MCRYTSGGAGILNHLTVWGKKMEFCGAEDNND